MEYSQMPENSKEEGDNYESMPAAMATLNMHQNGGAASQKQPKLRPVILVGCKSDLASERQVDYLDGERTAESFQAPYIECSASNNQRVEDVFELALIQLFKQEKLARDEQMREQESKQKAMLSGSSI